MTKEELNQRINYCLDENTGIEIYFGMRGGECKKGNFAAAVQDTIKDMFIGVINTKILSDEVVLMNLSTADDRKDVIYQYDLEHKSNIQGSELLQLVAPSDNGIQFFSFDDDKISDIDSLIIKIGNANNDLVIFRKIPAINNYARMAKSFMFGKRGNIFDLQSNEFVKITPGAEFLLIDEEFFILDLKYFEQTTRFHAPIFMAAHNQIGILGGLGFLEDIAPLIAIVDEDITLARKLSKINDNSPTLNMLRNGHLSLPAFIHFTRNHPALNGKFKYSQEGKLSLTTKNHIKYLIKVLNDDYLVSQLTNIAYDSKAKDQIQ